MISLFVIVLGFAAGISVGAGFVAFLSALGIIPRFMQLTKTIRYIHAYEWSVVIGGIIGSWVGLRNVTFHFSKYIMIPIGLLDGIYLGMFAAALTEVLNVLPILAKRIRMDKKIVILLMAIVFGKMFGSLFQWIYFVNE